MWIVVAIVRYVQTTGAVNLIVTANLAPAPSTAPATDATQVLAASIKFKMATNLTWTAVGPARSVALSTTAKQTATARQAPAI